MKATGVDFDLVIHFDGCCQPNPGEAAYGVVVTEPDGTTATIAVGIGYATNNVAEWKGLIAALREGRRRGARRVHIIGDSRLVVEQANGRWKVKKAHFRPLQREAHALMAEYEHVLIEWACREQNEAADSAAALALA